MTSQEPEHPMGALVATDLTDTRLPEVVTALQAQAAVIEAAVEWVERIHDHPNLWADDEAHALISAVKALTGSTYSWENT